MKLKNKDKVICPTNVAQTIKLNNGEFEQVLTQSKEYEVSDVQIHSYGTYFTIQTNLGNAIRCKLTGCPQINYMNWEIIKPHWFIRFLDKIAFIFN